MPPQAHEFLPLQQQQQNQQREQQGQPQPYKFVPDWLRQEILESLRSKKLIPHLLPDTSKKELIPSSLVQSEEVAINTSENRQTEKSKIDQASNNLIGQVSKNPQEEKYSDLTETDLNAVVILTAMRFYNDCVKVMYGSGRNGTTENSNK